MLKFLIITICIFLLFRLMMKPILRFLLNRMVKKMAGKQGNSYHSYSQKGRREGSIHVDYMPGEEKRGRKGPDAGEYVDYEEVK